MFTDDTRQEVTMKTFLKQTVGRKPRSGLSSALAAFFLIFALSGCDSLLDVDLPGVVVYDQFLSDPGSAPTMVVSALGEFECALPQYIISSGIIAHEFQVSGIIGVWQNWGALRDVARNDEGACTGSRTATNVGIFNPLSRARVLSEDGYDRISAFSDAEVPGRADLLAQLAAYAGYSNILLGEGMCEVTIDNGPAIPPSQVMARAEGHFDRAIPHAQASGNTSILNMALVGRARVRLNQGDAAGAISDAQQVEQGFARYAEYATVTARRENNIHNSTWFSFHMSVHPDYRNPEVQGVPDPRSEARDMESLGVDNITDQWAPEKYSERDSPIRIASWEEAQLIIAEATGGQAAVDIINNLRDQYGLPHFEGGTNQEIMDQILEERAREFFLEGHRLNDMLRHNLPFPTGTNHKGAAYGSLTCVPLSDAERSANPNLS
jgi:starch-binding outer membrane protein, SusD/RagB family